MFIARILLAIAALGLPGASVAQPPPDITAAEMALIPSYCPDTQLFSKTGTQSSPDARQKQWLGVMGKTFWAMHHYCWALIAAARAERYQVKDLERTNYYRKAINDIRFVLDNATPDFLLLPELYTKLGEYAHKLKRDNEALSAFRSAARSKPDYWPAYARMADLYRENGRLDDARQAVEEGLKHAPSSTSLKRRQEELAKAGKGGASRGERGGEAAAGGAQEAAPVAQEPGRKPAAEGSN